MKMSPMSEVSAISSTSTTAQRRKIKKPLIEKRRRLRINQSLANLKSLVLEATKKDENCFPKMEKADILEMTVAYMKTTKHRFTSASGPASSDNDDQVRTYLSGFQECVMQVCSFLMDESAASVGGPDLCGQLTRHLSGCFQRMESDLRNRTDQRGTATAFRLNSNAETAKVKKASCEDRLYPSSSEKSSTSTVAIPGLSPLPAASSPPNFKAEMPRHVRSSGIPFHLSPGLHSYQEPSRDCTAAKPPSRPTTKVTSQTKVVLNNHHSTFPYQSNCPSLTQQHPNCLSPKKGDDFPASAPTLPPPIPLTGGQQPKSPLNPFGQIRPETIPSVDGIQSVVWRPW